MRLFFIALFLNFQGLGDESFITHEEYGRMLYENPRGISCVHCHGKMGEGTVIGYYRVKNLDKNITAGSIHNLSYEQFELGLNERQRNMPRYFLSKNEIKTIYDYLFKIGK